MSPHRFRLVNAGGVTADLTALERFAGRAPGLAVRGVGDASGTPYLQLGVGDLHVNVFERAIYADAAEPAAGWAHLSLETDDLDAVLADPAWAAVLLWGPREIKTRDDRRRIAFFEPAPGIRVELMQIDPGLPPAAEAPGAATLYEANGRSGAVDARIAHRAGTPDLLGPALTVECHLGDNLAVHRAVASARAGDVLVIAGAGTPVGYVGDILVTAALQAGVAGLVVDGGVRDLAALRELGLPVWSAHVAIAGATKVTPGRIGGTVVVGGVAVTAGDIVRADLDGVAVIARGRWPQTLRRAFERDEQEAGFVRRIREGASTLELFGLGPAAADGDH